MKSQPITLKKEALSDFEDSIRKEWIVTNGLGGYASSTVLGINTRKYHGLLVAAFHPPKDRRICLAKLDEEISVGNNVFPLSSNEFQTGVFPRGHLSLREFSISPFPKYDYVVEDIQVQKTVFMPHGKNAVVTLYTVSNDSSSNVKTRVFPLINWRHFHSVTDRWKINWEFVQKQEAKGVDILFGVPQSTLMMTTTSGQYFADGKWIEDIYFREEAGREESCLDDCYRLGYFETNVKANRSEKFAITAVVDKSEDDTRRTLAEMPITMYDAEALYHKEMQRRDRFLTKFYGAIQETPVDTWLDWVVFSTDMFIVEERDSERKYVIAGYPWFETWGRDTFISLPGLTLVTGRFEDARQIFLTFKEHHKEGLIPNFLPDMTEVAAYNTVDATLWCINALLQYLKYTGDYRFVQEKLWETLKLIIEKHERGTAFHIRVSDDGLLSHGQQLTWMDAAIDGHPATPRAGKAVEVQALWYNALKTMELLASKFKEKTEAEKYAEMAEKAKEGFNEKFWNPKMSCLFDTIDEHYQDDSLRPNQIIAVALDFPILEGVKSESVVDVVHRELLTPYGLRTLARNDQEYVGRYIGNRRDRDKAYHNGTVWPWLLGPFTTAFLKTKGYSEYRREYALKKFLIPFFTTQIFDKLALGTISEIFDGEPPYTPRGCVAQAWSVAEPLRTYVEDIRQVRPKHEREVLQDSR